MVNKKIYKTINHPVRNRLLLDLDPKIGPRHEIKLSDYRHNGEDFVNGLSIGVSLSAFLVLCAFILDVMYY